MNKVERSLGTASALMAYGPALVDVDLEDDVQLEISSDDPPDYYHTLRTSPNRTRHNTIGPYLTRNQIEKYVPNAWEALKSTVGCEAGAPWLWQATFAKVAFLLKPGGSPGVLKDPLGSPG